MRILAAALVLLTASCVSNPAPPAGTDADTAAWWSITGDLSSDAMEGRDTGSPAYDRAAKYVADRFAAAGLKPAGENGGWYQTIPLKEVRVEKEGTKVDILFERSVDPKTGVRLGDVVELSFLHEVTVRPSWSLPSGVEAPLVFRGYCSPADLTDVREKIVVCFGARRSGMTTGAQRLEAAAKAGALGLINVDDPGFTIEPSRWPEAYARSISFREAPPVAYPEMIVLRLAAGALAKVIDGSGQNADAILAAGAASRPLPSFDIAGRLRANFRQSTHELKSDNVLALLPGMDPKLKDEIVIVSAHLDGYGYGEPVNGDSLYNGAFDDAAYIATLIRLAERQAGKGFKRSVLFAAYTGEEKGLLGSNWFSTHLTVPKENLAAVVNLDQLRPLFPLKALTMHAIDDTTLAGNVRRVASAMNIEVRPDLEPERNLNQRTDHWPFLRMSVPATNFVFAFDPGSESERRYREWYQVRYHRPQDDMTQPLDWDAAYDMNLFFYRLTEDIANDPVRPSFLPASQWAPK